MTISDRCKLIATFASRFRFAIELTDKAKLPDTFREFPSGSCGDVVPLLGHFLKVNGHGEFRYMLGAIGDAGSVERFTHAWLQQGSIVVDITADQFPGVENHVIVSNDSQWHNALSGHDEHIADFDVYDCSTSNILRAAYKTIVTNLPCS